jgi:catechol 2,3-dioxygenase-like lactoylglutathione lyase family enzyme
MRIHHVQLMMPRGREDEALRFYVELLGLARIPKPSDMPNPEGLWLSLGEQELHLGVQDAEIDRASRAHVALVTDDLDALSSRLSAAGIALAPSNEIAGLRRVHVRDPFGNRLELMGR